MIEKMIATVQIYIHHRKGVEVNIAIRNHSDLHKLTKAYNIANQWLNNNGFVQYL
jgi:predicted glycosyltransferase